MAGADGMEHAMVKYETDQEYADKRLTSVVHEGDGYSITGEDGWCFYCPGGVVEPKPGDIARFWGKGIGFPVRGLAINGTVVFYLTPEEDRARHEEQVRKWDEEKRQKFEEHRAEHDAAIAALPEPFQRRIARFQHNNPDFRWQHESYELFCCKQAVAIADRLKAPEAVSSFAKLGFEEQMAMVPEIDEGHSGNTFGAAVRLAMHYVSNPEYVVLEHGALCPLVGCRDYGCIPPGATEYPG